LPRRAAGIVPAFDGMTMKSGPYCIEGATPAGTGGDLSDRPEKPAGRHFRSGFVGLVAALMVGFAGWMLLSGKAGNRIEGRRMSLAIAASPERVPAAAMTAIQGESAADSATVPLEAIAPVQAPPVQGLRISSQSWRRGGLGSNALITFTLRNANDYAVRDIEISCVFVRRDGTHLTDRTRTLHDIVNTRSRRTLARLHIGFVNVNADRAKCSPVNASRI